MKMNERKRFAQAFTSLSVVVLFVAYGCAGADDDLGELGGVELELGQDPSQLELESRRDRIREHFADRLAEMDIRATTRTDSGAVIDWVPRAPNMPMPPQTLVPLPELAPGEALVRSPLESQPHARGPAGTVPVARFDVEGYLRAIGDDVPLDPHDAQPPSPSPASNGRYYTEWRATTSGTGHHFWAGAATFNIWTAPDLASGELSNAQMAMYRGSGAGLQTVEAGKIQWSGFNSGNATFFVYFTTNNYASTGPWFRRLQPKSTGLVSG